MDAALVGVIGVVVGGVIGLGAQLLTSRITVRQAWAETRRVVYSEFLEQTSVGKHRLDAAVQRRIEESAVDADRTLAQGVHEQAVAGWNRVRLISQSRRVQEAARELSVRIFELRGLVTGEQSPTEDALRAIKLAYDVNRTAFIDAAQQEIGLTRRA